MRTSTPNVSSCRSSDSYGGPATGWARTQTLQARTRIDVNGSFYAVIDHVAQSSPSHCDDGDTELRQVELSGHGGFHRTAFGHYALVHCGPSPVPEPALG